MATMLPGVRPIMRFASDPTARMPPVLLLMATTPEALNIGMGLLMFISGIELGYTPLEPSISVSVLLGLMTLLVGFAIAYLTLADGSVLLEQIKVELPVRAHLPR
ncbi:MAG: hypothetical protein NTX29_16065, partial [Actinobacteria bacterium]|nr:hypothetical protein [Actinomycetota bacterium]